MEGPEVRIGLLGLGQMGRNHLRVLSMLRGANISFVYDSDGSHARTVAAEHGVRAVDDIEPSLEEVDALIICTPTSTHASYVERFVGRVRALFVEKPLAHSVEAARRVERIVSESGVLLQVGFIERFNPAIAALHRVLQNAERVISIDFTRTNKLSARITDVDVIMDLMIHDIDLALYLNGPVEAVSAHGVRRGELIEFASAQLRHANGRFSRLQASRITEKKMRLVQATCEDRFVECDLLRKEIVIHRQSVLQQSGGSYSIASQQEAVTIGLQEALLSELQAFIQLARGEATSVVPNIRDGVESLVIADAIAADVLRDGE
ncbi:Gfo/Idh/MocA family oxidoreductase [Tsuneonella sp. YG55]|uniref:Gfo/Idh/MocA family oxidoreductase n=2 Tax=Tsuneonella litorea TaxID=2976475 RepID=A0A9X2VZ33_9SPHN|nr:Gfo/Idh/MocA family oxidoreductase [Tsuneonella litorea]